VSLRLLLLRNTSITLLGIGLSSTTVQIGRYLFTICLCLFDEDKTGAFCVLASAISSAMYWGINPRGWVYGFPSASDVQKDSILAYFSLLFVAMGIAISTCKIDLWFVIFSQNEFFLPSSFN
jgi:hypothetical protein